MLATDSHTTQSPNCEPSDRSLASSCCQEHAQTPAGHDRLIGKLSAWFELSVSLLQLTCCHKCAVSRRGFASSGHALCRSATWRGSLHPPHHRLHLHRGDLCDASFLSAKMNSLGLVMRSSHVLCWEERAMRFQPRVCHWWSVGALTCGPAHTSSPGHQEEHQRHRQTRTAVSSVPHLWPPEAAPAYKVFAEGRSAVASPLPLACG